MRYGSVQNAEIHLFCSENRLFIVKNSSILLFIDSFFCSLPARYHSCDTSRDLPLKNSSIKNNFLFHIEYQSFKILSLGVVDVHGVVGRLGELVQNAHVAFCHCGGSEHRCAEILFAHYL